MATANYFVCLSIFRFALPLLLLVSIIFRPCVLSGIYLLFLLYLPMVPIPSPTTMKGHTGIYLKLLLTVCIINFLCQITFQILMVANAFDTSGLTACSDLERILRTVGFVEWNSMHAVSMATWITPEVIMTVGSILIFVVLRKLNIEESESNEEMVGVSEPAVYANKPKRISRILGSIGKYLTLVLICVAAVLKPSVEGGLYFLIFLSSCTWWACNKELKRGYGIVLRCLMILVFCHIFALFIYQMQWPQELLDSDDLYARLFGLTPLMRVTCAAPREFKWTNAEWLSYLNPLILILLFYILAIESTHLLKPQVERKNDSSSETTPLISGVSPTKRYGSGKSTSAILQDSTGSVTVLEDVQDDIPMQQLGKSPPEDEIEPTLLDNIFYVVESLIHIIIRSSYIATNIIMMTWSIMFHSWITFILLLWANILWMVPNQRKTMFYCSPFLVLYAWFLLLSGYIYSMDLKESELPTEVNGVDLQLIGFQRVQEMACNPLLIKCLFTVMFWITLRQFIQERKESRQNSALADMVAPLQITVGAAAGVGQRETITSGSKTMKLIGEYTKTFLTKFWIWIVAITLFGVAITGERMTCFRIIYMALFLFFIITFQLSFTVWRRVMFGFWGTVILYSMIVLILTYTYQFPNIRGYWTDYLHVSKVIQADIGLEDFGAKQLFIRLVTPTFFVIITAIQIHYFHKDFMEMSIPKNITTEPFSEGSSAQGGIIEPSSEKTDVESSLKYDLTDIASISPTQIRATFTSYFIKLQHIVNIGFLFLEIHLPKLIIFFAMLMCVYDKCAAYVVVIIFVVLSCILGRPIFLFSTYTCSILSSLMILARMIYQVGYFQEDEWNVTCTKESGNSTQNVTENNADWLGISKAKHGTTVPSLVQWNLYYIITVTLWSVVSVRQYHHRVARGRSTNRAYFIFPRIKRSDADKNVKNCIKYLLNYGYYKFGVEISLLSTVLLIAIRMDLYAMFYAFWLVILFCCTRRWLRKIWPFYLVFIGFLLALQYCLLIGLPPSLCILFSWNPDSTVNRLEAWALLIPFNLSYPAKRLLCDFIVLAFVSRQSLVFRIEARHENAEYPGGSNSSIIHHAENKDFVNPVPDFITYCRSYLDVFKRTIFLSFMWLSLAIMFLAGTNRANLFSIGYLIGSFLFLWKGSDIYLKPIDKILKSWDWLLGYNVAVILIKSMLQLAGCVYIKTLQENACWFVRLLAISCAQNFDETSTSQLLRPEDQCDVPPESAGLSWDAVCFGFLLFQRRIFNSFYFFHMVNETKAATILASRGADLIEELTQKRMREQEEGERKILEKIKAKMDRIKASQKRIQGPHYQDTNNHYVDGIFPDSRPRYRRRKPKSYRQAVLSGDYYMFDELDDNQDLDLIEETSKREDMDDEDTIPQYTVGEVGARPHSVVIIDPKEEKMRLEELKKAESKTLDKTDSEPRPGTSKDEDISELTEPDKESVIQKIVNVFLFVWVFIESLMVSCIIFLNKYSREYRYILKVLNKEKKVLKERTQYHVGLRLGTGRIWQPAASYQTLLKDTSERQSPVHFMDDIDDTEMSSVDQPTIVRLGLACWYIVLSHSDILCYFIIFLNQIKSATFLSLPLPFMVFLWGTLSIPRPTKTFWVTIIAYTEVIVLIKCIFQFEVFRWNKTEVISPLYPPRIIGIERQENYALWDLLVLLIVFFHRFLLKCLGLWKSIYIPAVLLPDGDYKITREISLDKDTSSIHTPTESGALVTATTSTSEHQEKPQNSELQKLVEESEESMATEPKDGTLGSGSTENEKLVSIKTDQLPPCSNYATSLRMALSKYGSLFKIFFKQMLDPTSRVAADVYSYMFMCDFFNFFVLLIGYSSFGGPQQGDEGVQAYLEDNRVPVLFLLMLILQFALIIIDRAIFLRKYIFGKVVFQYLQIIVLHIWLFILYPVITDRGFNSVIPPQMYYMVKCFYLLLSAYQIRCGYPTRILGNFLCKGYGYVHMFAFKIFMIIPFLFELRTVMDWMWTDTSMTVFDWIKMEDIFAHIFQIKCTRHVEAEFPQPRGEKKNPIVKYLMGGGALLLMIALIWFPLVFFSLGNAVGKPNIPYDVSIDLRIGPYEPIYQMSVQSNSIHPFNSTSLNMMLNVYSRHKAALTFINNYEAADIAAVQFSIDSATVWTISPPDRVRMVDEVKSANPLNIKLQYIVSHKSNTKEDTGSIREEVELQLTANDPIRTQLSQMLEDITTNRTKEVPLQNLFPKFIKVTNRGTANVISQFMEQLSRPEDKKYRNISVLRMTDEMTPEGPLKEWWEMKEICGDENDNQILKKLPFQDNCRSLILYTFNDKIFPSQLNFITAGGIIGVYTTIVLVAGRLLRGFFAGSCFQIMFEDMPNVDRVLQLCYDVYLVREVREFSLEEDLFAKLIFLFRSPETLIKWTRPKEEVDDDEEEEEEDESINH